MANAFELKHVLALLAYPIDTQY